MFMSSEDSYHFNLSGHREPSFRQYTHGNRRPGHFAASATLPQAGDIPPVCYYDQEGSLFVAVHKSQILASPHEDFVYVSAHGFPRGE